MMNRAGKKLIAAAVLPLTLSSGAFAASDAELQERVKRLEAELKSLVEQMQQKELMQQKKGVELKKGTRFQYGGFIKVDAMVSDYSDGERAAAGLGDEILVPSVIPVNNAANDGSARFDSHVKTSRFWFKTNTDTEAGTLRSHVELDLWTGTGDERISNSSHSRLRHAFVAWDYSDTGSLLAGQTWSTFFNVGALPEAVDFIGPTSGTIFNRQTQLRWTKKTGDGKIMVALENPSSGFLDGGGGIAGNNFDDNGRPDLVVRYDGKAGNLSYGVAGVSREIAYDTGSADESEQGFALSFSGKYMFGNGDDLKFMVNHGNLGRYIALQAFRDGFVETDGSIDLLDVTGGFLAYRHHWNKQLRSTISYAMSSADNPDIAAATTTETVSNASINLIYSPAPKLSFGAEYLVADRELENGDEGDLKRLQFMAKYVF